MWEKRRKRGAENVEQSRRAILQGWVVGGLSIAVYRKEYIIKRERKRGEYRRTKALYAMDTLSRGYIST